VFLSPHKFAGGPQTPGVLVVHRDLLRNTVPVVPGGGTVSYVGPDSDRYTPDAVAREQGAHRPSSSPYAHLHHHFVTALLDNLFGMQTRGGCSCAGPYGHHLLGIDSEQSHAHRDVITEQDIEAMKPGWTRVSFPYFMSDAAAPVPRAVEPPPPKQAL
jgi:selenocysteine lyase/cysteine desulfurase